MARLIKFRAWNSEDATMLYSDHNKTVWVGGLCASINSDGQQVKAILYNNVMQFTGLIDINDKEIWEGDIVKISVPDGEGNLQESISQVEYSGSGFVVDETYPLDALIDCVDVIGNIYENAELLQEA